MLIYKYNHMKWAAVEEESNVFIGYNNPFDPSAEPMNIHKDLLNKYRPDKEMGNTGEPGTWVIYLHILI